MRFSQAFQNILVEVGWQIGLEHKFGQDPAEHSDEGHLI